MYIKMIGRSSGITSSLSGNSEVGRLPDSSKMEVVTVEEAHCVYPVVLTLYDVPITQVKPSPWLPVTLPTFLQRAPVAPCLLAAFKSRLA